MNYHQCLRYLEKREKFGIKLGLANIKRLLKKIGSPEKNLRIIHVAGTNGKGSVCAMISSMLFEAGYKVGMYTSPHLVSINERFKINGKNISNRDFAKYLSMTVQSVDTQTYFEITTAMAFLYFKEQNIDFAVIEVGMGGRLDSTNVAIPIISIITNIALEHTQYLGVTIRKIAYEKAGIIKNNIPVVTGAKGDALKVIKSIAEKRNSPLLAVKKFEVPPLGLQGKFQMKNAAIAVAAINVLKGRGNLKISKAEIKNGLNKTKWDGRMQFIGKNLLLDCAHNPDGMAAFAKEAKLLKKRFNRLIIIIGIMKDKDIGEMANEICNFADKIIITKVKGDRAAEPKWIAKFFKKHGREFEIKKNVYGAFWYSKSIAGKNDLIVVTGSCYLIGEFLSKGRLKVKF